MLMTVEQAKKVWCPCARVMALGNGKTPFGPYNLAFDMDDKKSIPINANCRANGCAAWRWKSNSEIAEIDLVTGDVEQRTGYCGLAGPVCL